MIPRAASATLVKLAKGFPVVCVTGPRQSGKTTLAKATFPDKPYLSLEDPDIAALARDDPRGLLDAYRDGLILDEAQSAPGIFAYLKSAVDRDPIPGRYVVTGSRQFDLAAGVTESLAGRAAFLRLMPFTVGELHVAGRLEADPFAAMIRGFYPPLYDRELTPYDWYGNYVSTYVERDLRSIVNVRDLGQFQLFLRMCASRIGQLLNLSALSLDCGLTHNTARAWLSVLETSGIVFLLRPYHRNYGKRLVKSPKLYFHDTGLAARLLGIPDAERLFPHPSRGALFESLVIADIQKTMLNQGLDTNLYFWRDNSGNEVDVVRETGGAVVAIEIKSGKTITPEMTAGLSTWMRHTGADPGECSLVYAGEQSLVNHGIAIRGWRDYLYS